MYLRVCNARSCTSGWVYHCWYLRIGIPLLVLSVYLSVSLLLPCVPQCVTPAPVCNSVLPAPVCNSDLPALVRVNVSSPALVRVNVSSPAPVGCTEMVKGVYNGGYGGYRERAE